MFKPSCIALILASLCLTACDENDAVSIRIRLRDDATGMLTTSGILAPTEATRVETAVTGVTVENRVQVSAASGRFTALNGIKVGDVAFSSGEGGDGLRYVKVLVPQGANAQWPDLFVPLDETARLKAAGALDPTGKSKDVGSALKLEIELPAPVIGNGLTGKVRGTKASSEGNVATLVVPIQAARGAADPLVWHITWQK